MIKAVLLFLLGCVLLLQLPYLPSALWLWGLLPVCILLFFIQTRFLAVFLLGMLWSGFYAGLILADQLPANLEGQNLVISGTISNVPEYFDRKIRFEFRPDHHDTITLPDKLRLNWYQPLPESINAGERWQLTVRLKQPRGMSNPGGFDYEGWLFQQNIGATGYVRTAPNNTRLTRSPFYSINALRQQLAHSIKLHLSDSQNLGMIQGLTTGNRHNISPQQWQILRLSGTSHLLAISGLHIGLAAAIGFFCFRWLWSRRANNLLRLPANQAGAVGGFLFALFYAALAGFAIPTQRALLMVTIVMVAVWLRLAITTQAILALSLLIILLFDPLSVLSAGFWLSFSAVAIILFSSQYRFPSPHWQWLKIPVVIAIGLAPLLLIFFMQASVISPLANIIAIPIISLLVVPILLLASVLLWVFEPLGIMLLQLAELILSLLWPLLQFFAQLPLSHWDSSAIPILYWIPISIGILLLLIPRGMPAKWLGIIAFLPLFFLTPDKPDKGAFWFTLLDVGQGLSAVVQTQHHFLVFDAGPKFSDRFNTGTAIVRPFLQQQGAKKIDTLIVSHGDNDHIGGAVPLIESIPVTDIFSSVPELIPHAKLCKAGQSWQWDGVIFTMLHPKLTDSGSENNLSCVLRISTANGSVLLTGDIEAETERLLIERYGDKLQSTILVAPHHGSKTSSSELFLDQVQADIVLFPVGYRNRYHFPNHQILERYTSKNTQKFNSANHGAIQFKIDSSGISIPITSRQANVRIWTNNIN